MTTIPLGGDPAPRSGRARSGRSRLLYEEVIDRVERLIVERALGPGDKLPSQDELSDLSGVSLITVRRALEELERAGRVRRHQGLGTFLASPKILSDPSHSGGLGDTLGEAAEVAPVGTKLLGVTRCRPSADLAVALQIRPDELVWQVHRQRLIADKPLIVETATIPVALAVDLDRVYQGGSLYETLAARYGLDDDYEEQFLDVVHPTARVRSLLHLSARDLVVRIRGITRDTSGVPFDVFEQVYPASEFAFVIAGRTNRRLHQGDLSRDWSATPLDTDVAAPPAKRSGRRTTRPASGSRASTRGGG
ncbi:MAG: GntR family transcriptional regulator [Nocardioidaceae bacterium]